MKMQTNKNIKKSVLITSAVIVLMATGVVYAYTQNLGPFKKDYSTQPASDDELSTGSDIKKRSLENSGISSSEDKVSPGSDPLPEPTPGVDGNKPTVDMEITAANQNGSILNIRTLIQTVSSTGTCNLSMQSQAGRTYTMTAEPQPQPSSTTCRGFDIPVSELTPGAWTIRIDFENEEIYGSASKEVIIK